MFRHYVAQLQRRSRRRVLLTVVMGLLDKRFVTLNGGEEFCGVFRQPVEKVDTDREVRAVDERAVLFSNNLLRLRLFFFPTRCTFDERHLRAHSTLDVFKDCIAKDRKSTRLNSSHGYISY